MKKLKAILSFCVLAVAMLGAAYGAAPTDDHSVSVQEALEKGNAALKDKNTGEAKKWFEEAAEQGNAEGQYQLGSLLWNEALTNEQRINLFLYDQFKGKEIKPARFQAEMKEGTDWMVRSAEQDYEQAEELLGEIYNTGGYGISANGEKALMWFEKAAAHFRDEAQKGNAKSQFKLGNILLDETIPANLEAEYKKTKGDSPTAAKNKEGLDWVRKSADQGYAPAETFLGGAYKDGTIYGVEKNDGKSFELYKRAAGHGDVSATYMVGWSLERGVGCPPNKKEAIQWYQKAADLGNEGAQDALWHLKSADKPKATGKVPGQEAMDKVKEWGAKEWKDNEERDQINQEYKKWYRIAAEKGNAEAQYEIGQDLIRKDCAMKLYKAPPTGDFKLDCKNDPQMKEGINWLRKSAGQGYLDAQYDLGDYYQTGIYVARDLSQARLWYQKAADQGYERASAALKKLNAEIKETHE